jgi:hypothetical protein
MPWTVLRVRFEAERRQVQFLLRAPNTKATSSTRVDGNRPGRDFPGFTKCIGPLGKAGSTSDDARVSRSSRVRKVDAGGKSCYQTEVSPAWHDRCG